MKNSGGEFELVIYDTEFTAWPGSQQRGWSEPWEHRELIQLAAVVVHCSTEGAHINQRFNELIKPCINPQISDYISQLTGIQQDTLEQMGVDFPSALALFHQFCKNGNLPCMAWGIDAQVLAENCQLNHIPMPVFTFNLGNLQQLATELALPCAQLSSGQLAQHLGLVIQGHNHNALYDVKSVTLALDHWLKSNVITLDQLASRAMAR